MSFDFPAQPQPQRQVRRGGCGRFILMLVIGFAVYRLFFSGLDRGGQQPRGGPGEVLSPVDEPMGGGSERDQIKRDIFGDGTVGGNRQPIDAGRRQMPSSGRSGGNNDWEMEELDTKPSSGTNRDFRNDSRLPSSNSNSPSRSKEDWSMSNVDSTDGQSIPAERPLNVKKKSKGDWSLDEVEVK
jgi:hypothetical protein